MSEFVTATSLLRQEIDPYFALHLLRKVGIEPTKADRQLFYGCSSIEEIIFRLSESGLIRSLFLDGTPNGLKRLGEFYIALRLEAKLSNPNNPGFDVWGAFQYADMILAGKVEVKTVTASKGIWTPRIAGYTYEIRSDVLVIVGLLNSYNPCEARLFAIPKNSIEPVARAWWKKERKDPRPRISISTNKYDGRTSDILNNWYEFYVEPHRNLRDYVSAYLAGQPPVIITEPMQLSLWPD